jgi:hypothetical protein
MIEQIIFKVYLLLLNTCNGCVIQTMYLKSLLIFKSEDNKVVASYGEKLLL